MIFERAFRDVCEFEIIVFLLFYMRFAVAESSLDELLIYSAFITVVFSLGKIHLSVPFQSPTAIIGLLISTKLSMFQAGVSIRRDMHFIFTFSPLFAGDNFQFLYFICVQKCRVRHAIERLIYLFCIAYTPKQVG
jgi:hypothetical protein